MSRCNADRHVHSDGTVPYWRLWSACFLGFGAFGMTIQVMPAYAHERLGANAIIAGLAVTIGSLATMISRPVSGRFADQSGGRRVAMAGAILALIGGIGHLVATNLPILVLARLLLGAGEGALFTGSVGWILAHTEQPQRGKVAGHFGLAMWMGLASGPMLGTALMATGTYRDVWIAASIIPMLSWVLVASTRPESRVSSGGTTIRRALFPKAAWVPGASGVFSSIRGHRGVSGAALRGSRLCRPKLCAHRVRHRVHDYTLYGQRICRSFRRETGASVSLPDRVRRTCWLISHTCGVARF
jgi:MFS family permease